jgi:hypothetical protein
MLYGRLSDLSLIAIERDFHVDYQRIIDVFATQHKNSRILLRPPPPPRKKSIFVKNVEMEIHVWEKSPQFTLSETI